MGIVYHGSKTQNLKELIPNESTHGKYIYATYNKDIATVMASRCGDDATYNFGRNSKEEPFQLVERVVGAFDKMFSNDYSIYTLDDSDFQDIHTGFDEVVTDHPVKIQSEEKMVNLFQRIYELEEEGKIVIYRYPDRPEYIPEDDMDLFEKMKNRLPFMDKDKIKLHTFTRWIFLHPNLENEFRELGESYGFNIPTYEEIKDGYIEAQMNDPEHEFYIDEAIAMKDIFKSKSR